MDKGIINDAQCRNYVCHRCTDGEAWHVVGGAVAGGVTQIGSNILSGRKWYKGVGSATVGGGVGGATFAATGSMAAASYAGSAAQSAVSQAGKYITGKKKVTWSNVKNSAKMVAKDTAVNGTVSLATGKALQGAGKLVSKATSAVKAKGIKIDKVGRLNSTNKGSPLRRKK